MVVGSPGVGDLVARRRRLASCWPDAVEVHPDLLALDDRLVRSLAVHGWPREVYPGWVLPLILGPDTLAASLYFCPLASSDQVARLTRRLVWNRGAQQAALRAGRLSDPREMEAIDDADALRRDLASGRSRMVRVGLALVVQGRSREELDRRTDAVISLAEGLMMPLSRGRFQQVDQFRATLPGSAPYRGQRDMDTQAAATLFPLVGDDRQDPGGEVWGEHATSHAPVVINRDLLPAPHSFTAAWSGAGKSFATKLLVLRARYHGRPVVVIDPEGEYRGLAGPSGLLTVGKGIGLNPLFRIGPDAGERARRAEFGVAWLEMLSGSLPTAIRRALVRHLYRQDDLTLVEWGRQIRAELPRAADRVEADLERWTAAMGQGVQALPPSGLTVVDLSEVPDSLRAAAYLVAVEYVLTTLKDGRPRWVVFDEAWRLLIHARLASYLEELYRRARKWRTTLMLVTQDAEDALRTPNALVCLRNSPLVLLLKPHPQALSDWSRLFRLTQPEAELLDAAGVGEGLLIADRTRLPIRIVASPWEKRLIQEAEAHVTMA